MANKKMRRIGVSVIALILAIVMAFGITACNPTGNGEIEVTPPSDTLPEDTPPVTGDTDILGPTEALPEDAFVNKYAAATEVGYYGKILNDDIERVKPVSEIKDEGLASYPVYGKTYNGTVAQGDIIAESDFLTATGTANAGGGGYTWMDESGRLFAGTRENPEATGRQLYQHTASVDMYHGNVADDEKGVVKQVTIRPRGYNSYSVTGIYAPAGEVIKIQISEEDMEATGGLTVHIGQALYNGQANNIWAGKGMPRMPHVLNTMAVNKDTAVLKDGVYTAYVGSFLGGPLYIRNTGKAFTATISGGVEYLHFILGYTTKAEFTRLQNSSAPYFDLEVWNYGVLHSGSRYYADRFSYEDLYKAAIFWEKVSLVTTERSKQGIVFLYDPFVAAGAAVAFPGRSSVNCPESWMVDSLDYNTMVTSGSWGNLHEYHHNFQGFGVGNGGEVTNNSLTLVSYALFTKISQGRSIENYGAGSLGWWPAYTSATWALEQTLKIARPNENPNNGDQGLALYATLLHNFGPNNFIQASVSGSGQSYSAYKTAWETVTHNNMDYYFNDILKGNTGASETAKSYPAFVPVSSVYQTGRSYTYDGQKKYFSTMQPYAISADEPFNVDLTRYTENGGQYQSGSIVIPDGFSYKVKSISKPARGTIKINDDNSGFIYTPDSNNAGLTSGQIVVTLEITKNDKKFKVDDVDLVLEFQPTKELNKSILERTIYTYAEGNGYTDAVEAFNNKFQGYERVEEKLDHTNPTQNANTDIWYWPNTDANHTAHPDAPDYHFAPQEKTVSVIDGKLYFENDGKYRVYLRGRLNCAVYFSLDGKNYELGAKIADSSTSAAFRLNDNNTYFDVEFKQGSVTVTVNVGGGKTTSYTLKSTDGKTPVNWLFVKEVLISQQQGNVIPYIGLGMAQWSESMFTIQEAYYDSSNAAVEDTESENYAYTETTYFNAGGVAVALQKTYKNNEKPVEYYSLSGTTRTKITLEAFSELTAEKPIAPTSANYVNAYRSSYEFPDNSDFLSEYFYTRNYDYTYRYDPIVVTDGVTQTYVGGNYEPWNTDGSHKVENLFDGNRTTEIHTKQGLGASTANPIVFEVELSKTVKANTLVLYARNNAANLSNAHQRAFPSNFKLEGSLDGKTYFTMGSWTSSDVLYSAEFNFTATFEFKYYRLSVYATHSNSNYVALSGIELRDTQISGDIITPDNRNLVFQGDWRIEQAFSTFGHVFVGKKDATLKFDFAGTRLGIISSSAFGKNFEVYIDGKKVNSVTIKEGNGDLTYLCDALGSGTHRVEIKCTGEGNIESLVVFR